MAHTDSYHFPGHVFDCHECQDGPCVCDADAVGCASMACRFDSIPFNLGPEPDFLVNPYGDHDGDLGHA